MTSTFSSARLPDVPEKMYEGVLYIEYRGGLDRWVRFLCPCGCGFNMMLSLQKSHHPHWTLTADIKGRVTLSPSINADRVCKQKSHYFIKDGNVVWAMAHPT